MFKRFITIWVVSFLFMPTFGVYADALVEQSDNAFFDRYRNECVYLGRSFYVNSADGFIEAKKEPGSNRGGSKIKNGETVYLEYSCLYKGEYWGLTNNENGWVKIDNQLLVSYDYVSFQEEHPTELYPYSGDYAEIKKTKAAVAWPWPGADSTLWTFEDLDTSNFRVLHAYKDEEGREWGFITYLYGSPNIWFCLSDPLNHEIPAFNPAPEPTVWKSDTVHNDIDEFENSGNCTLILIIILVAILVIGTVILIKVFWKSNENKGREKE